MIYGNIDEWVFYKGKGYKDLPENVLLKRFILVVGNRAIGKSIYAKNMSQYNDIYYVEVQQIHELPRSFINLALEIIEIKNIKEVE